MDLPIIATGGFSTPEGAARGLVRPGMVAVSCGTAFLQSHEAGTNDFNRELVKTSRETTVAARALSGRMSLCRRSWSGLCVILGADPHIQGGQNVRLG